MLVLDKLHIIYTYIYNSSWILYLMPPLCGQEDRCICGKSQAATKGRRPSEEPNVRLLVKGDGLVTLMPGRPCTLHHYITYETIIFGSLKGAIFLAPTDATTIIIRHGAAYLLPIAYHISYNFCSKRLYEQMQKDPQIFFFWKCMAARPPRPGCFLLFFQFWDGFCLFYSSWNKLCSSSPSQCPGAPLCVSQASQQSCWLWLLLFALLVSHNATDSCGCFFARFSRAFAACSSFERWQHSYNKYWPLLLILDRENSSRFLIIRVPHISQLFFLCLMHDAWWIF